MHEFVAQQPGTFFAHSNSEVDRKQTLGMYGALIIEPCDTSDQTSADHELVVQL